MTLLKQLADMTLMAAEEIRNFGIQPGGCSVSHSTFGQEDSPTSIKMREVLGHVESTFARFRGGWGNAWR